MRKFYSSVSIIPAEDAYSIALDTRPVKTPLKTLLTVRTEQLARAIADEWRAQGETIDPHSMPLTQLASTAIDRIAPHKPAIIEALLDYAETDLVCYRAIEPDDLVTTQAALFDPLLEWFEDRSGATLIVARGVMPVDQPPETIAAVKTWLHGKSPEALTAIQVGAALASSLVIALALCEGELSAEDAFQAACCEELYQIKKWGDDDEAVERLAAVRREFQALERFVGLQAV